MQFHLTIATLTTIVVPDISVKTTDVSMLAEHTTLVRTTKTVSTKGAKIHAVSSTHADRDQLAIPMTTSQYVAANLDFSVIQREAASLQVLHLLIFLKILRNIAFYFKFYQTKFCSKYILKNRNVRELKHSRIKVYLYFILCNIIF